jgi:hypothetical protein
MKPPQPRDDDGEAAALTRAVIIDPTKTASNTQVKAMVLAILFISLFPS